MKNQSVSPIVSCRVRLARNLTGFAFPSRLKDADEVKNRVRQALANTSKTFDFLEMNAVPALKAGCLMEEHLISPAFLNRSPKSAVALEAGGEISVMVNEEDHLRLQTVSSVKTPRQLYGELDALDDALAASLDYAYDASFGYLTASPVNLGTGLRVSVMVHLPALTRRGWIGEMIDEVSRMGVTVRGLYGEGTKARGDFYQISNTSGFGLGEEEILQRIEQVVDSVVKAEEKAREVYRDVAEQEEIYRAYGMLKETRLLSSADFRSLYSLVRTGCELNLEGISLPENDSLFTAAQPYHMALEEKEDEKERDIRRAAMVRKALAERV